MEGGQEGEVWEMAMVMQMHRLVVSKRLIFHTFGMIIPIALITTIDGVVHDPGCLLADSAPVTV